VPAATTGSEARVICGLYAALKGRSSTVVLAAREHAAPRCFHCQSGPLRLKLRASMRDQRRGLKGVRICVVPPGLGLLSTSTRHCRAGLSHAAASRLRSIGFVPRLSQTLGSHLHTRSYARSKLGRRVCCGLLAFFS